MAMADGMATNSQHAPGNTANPPPGVAPLNLSSNNPFRNRLSTASPSPRSADAAQPNFPFPNMSKNPFLDPNEVSTNAAPSGGAVNGDGVTLADDIFKDLSLLDKPKPKGPPPRGAPLRSDTLPNQTRPLGPGDRRDAPPRPRPRNPDSPQKRPEHRRRASESSMMEHDRRDRGDRDRGERGPRTESEERRRRERRKEREERHRREKERIRNGEKPRNGKPQRNLDLIDKLDVTGIYGQGLFHHDGPFDACNPHRNAKKDRRAPMQAFPEGSANMMLGGAGPLNSRLDLDRFHGRTEEGFSDFATTRKAAAPQYVHPTDRIEQVHGAESYGLGTSTFLEGAPASKRALQRRESEEQAAMQESLAEGGLGRKKSIAQRLRGRGMSATRPRGPPGAVRSPEAQYNNAEAGVTLSDDSPPQLKAQSAGGPSRTYTKENEINPFFETNDYDSAFEKKGTQIRIAEQEKPNIGRARAPSSPKANGLTRTITGESATRTSGDGEEKPSLLTRMKSLKGGKRTRPERKDSNSAA